MEEDNIIVLSDETGQEHRFEFLDLEEYQGNEYVILFPEDDPDGMVVILQVQDFDDETETYVGVEDEAALEAVFALFKEKYQDEFDFTD